MDRAHWSQRFGAPLLTTGAVALATVALRLHDPHRYGSWGLCPFKLITGWDCPFCGGLRAVNDLTHENLVAAWHSNALFIAAVPLLATGWVLWWWKGSVPRPHGIAGRVLTGSGVAVAVAFTIWRNTPWGSAFHAT